MQRSDYQDEAGIMVKYQAAWSPADPDAGTAAEVTVVRDVQAGISGPHGSEPADSLDAADAALLDRGFRRTGDWTPPSYDGGSHWAPITRHRHVAAADPAPRVLPLGAVLGDDVVVASYQQDGAPTVLLQRPDGSRYTRPC